MAGDNSGLLMKYFVLSPDGDSPYHLASREAMRAYAYEIRETNPDLYKDLIAWVQKICKERDLPLWW